jgi:prepilin-type processing-associated H-X9-DG protein
MTTPFLSSVQISRSQERMVFIGAHSSMRWIVDGFWPISDINPEVARWAAPSSNNITIRHTDGCNLSFADSHCEYWKWTDPRTIKFAKQQISADEASVDNPDLQRMLDLLKGPLD